MLTAFPGHVDVEMAIGDAARLAPIILLNNSSRGYRVAMKIEGPGAGAFFYSAPRDAVAPGQGDAATALEPLLGFVPQRTGHHDATLVVTSPDIEGSLAVPLRGRSMRAGDHSAKPTNEMNPTYVNARLYAEDFFQRQSELGSLLATAAQNGLAQFRTASKAAYNASSSLAFSVFEVALAALPGGKAIAGAAEEVFAGMKAARFAKSLARLTESLEPITATAEAGNKIHEIADGREKQAEAKEEAAFELEVIHDLAQLTARQTAQRWYRKDAVRKVIEPLQYSDPNMDLYGLVKGLLGQLPDPSILEKVVDEAADRFEYELYVKYYADAGIAKKSISRWHGAWLGAQSETIEGVALSVQQRINDLETRFGSQGNFKSHVKGTIIDDVEPRGPGMQ